MRVISLSCAVLYGQIQASADQDHRLRWCVPPGAVAGRAQTDLTGSGSRRSSYGGFRGGYPHFHPHTGTAQRSPRCYRHLTRRLFYESCRLGTLNMSCATVITMPRHYLLLIEEAAALACGGRAFPEGKAFAHRARSGMLKPTPQPRAWRSPSANLRPTLQG
jgi:hypothetical protein